MCYRNQEGKLRTNHSSKPQTIEKLPALVLVRFHHKPLFNFTSEIEMDQENVPEELLHEICGNQR